MSTFPLTGYLRLPQIIGSERAKQSSKATHTQSQKRSPNTTYYPPLIPVARSSWWAGVRSGRYPAPVKLGPRTTVWRAEDIRALIDGAGKAQNATNGHGAVGGEDE